MEKNEQEQFLEDTNADITKVDVLEAPLFSDDSVKIDEGQQSDENDTKEGMMEPKNRRERRLIERLEAEKQSSAFLAGKLEARTEAQSALTEEADYLKSIERIYGTDTPEAQLATDLLKKAITGARDDAENRAYERVKSERQKETEAQRDAESELDSMIDEIEETHGVTLNETQERSFFQLLEKMSPKDREGNVKEYADPEAVWEVFSERLNKRSPESNRAKDLSSRSMVNSGSSKESNLQDDVHARFLRDNGII